MKKNMINAIVVLAILFPVSNAFAIRTGKSNTPAPVIMSAEIKIEDNELVISGYHFGRSMPIVRLGAQVLSVKSHSEKEALVILPSDIRPATYRLRLTTDGRYKLSSDPFSVTIPFVANR